MYAKVFQSDEFNTTNIITVQVGEQVPYSGTPFTIPGTIEGGNYDKFEGGVGQNIAYVDNDQSNQGDYRTEEYVDAVLDDTEGPNVGWISAGEWLEYTIDVQTAGLYDVTVRYASGNANGGGPFHFEIDGTMISPAINCSATGDWAAWTNKVVNNVTLTQGKHILRLVVTNGEFNLGRMTFAYANALSYVPPIADAGENVVVILPETTATLDGTGSNDPEGETITYHWEQIYGPSIINFNDNTAQSPNISNLEGGIYKCKLTVSDGTYSASSFVLVVVQETANTVPTINLTAPNENASFPEGADITMTATASDLDGMITLVEFYDGTTKIGMDDTEPFSFTWTGATVGTHQLKAVATDNGGAQGTSQTINVTVNEVKACTESDNQALQGAFSTGYKATFETVGTSVTMTFELLDTDKAGVVAYLWRQDPFGEVQMDHVEGLKFSKTIGGLTPGATINYACKFAFAGGLAVTKYISYQVGDNCSGGGGSDTAAPTNFTATVGEITATSVELLLNGTDDSGTVIYNAAYETNNASASGITGVQKSLVITGLSPETPYTFNVTASDLTGNSAANNPIILIATTIADASNACSGTSADSQQGAFSTGYTYNFKTSGTSVTFTFELLDTDRSGVVAYLWRQSPFGEVQMDNVSGLTFSKTVTGLTPGSTVNYGCKFAFAGGLAVTKYFSYEVGEDCAPVNTDCIPTGIICLEATYPATYDNTEMPIQSDLIENCANTTIESGAKMELTAKSNITLKAGFHAKQGSAFHATISTKEYCTDNLQEIALETVQHKTTFEQPLKNRIGDGFELNLYPNPANNYITITSKTAAKIKSITIYNLYGQQVFIRQQDLSVSRIDLNLDLPIGTYLIQGIDENNNRSIKKMMVQD